MSSTYLRYVPGGCPGYYRPVHSLAEVCTQEHCLVGDRVYHVKLLAGARWKRVQARVAAEKAAEALEG